MQLGIWEEPVRASQAKLEDGFNGEQEKEVTTKVREPEAQSHSTGSWPDHANSVRLDTW